MVFVPGVSGNPAGTKHIWRAAIQRAVQQRASGEDPRALDKLATKLVEKGLEGDVTALKEIGDRLDGKVKQVVDAHLTGEVVTVSITDQEIIARYMEAKLAQPGTNNSDGTAAIAGVMQAIEHSGAPQDGEAEVD